MSVESSNEQALITSAEAAAQQQIILHEDKNYYPSAEEVYGEAEVVVGDEDTQSLETPIIAPIKHKQFVHAEKEVPVTTFDYKFLAGLMDHPSLIRHVGVVGQLHHGKTSFVDIFVEQTHPHLRINPHLALRYTDTRFDEQKRQLSIKSCPVSLVLPSSTGKHFLLNLIDTPGHVNFSDEQSAALRLVDGAVIIVDAVEGVMAQTARSIKHVLANQVPLLLVINKMDRLILELKLPPSDAYHKLVHTIEEVNALLVAEGYPHRLSPELGNVAFASCVHGWIFTLDSFANLYALQHNLVGRFDTAKFARRLWGDMYVNEHKKFISKPTATITKRSFVQFILEPLYKIYAHTIGSEDKELAGFLTQVGIVLTKAQIRMDHRPLLKEVCRQFFGDTSGFVDMLIGKFPSPVQAADVKVRSTYTGSLATTLAQGMLQCNPKSTLMLNITKLYARTDGATFDAFGRVLSGTIKVGDRVRVLGQGYTLDDSEDQAAREITKIWIYQGRYRVEVNRVTAGNWALFEGLDAVITKTATVTSVGDDSRDACIFRPLSFNVAAVMKVAIEPILPSDLPKMSEGLRKVDKSYPASQTRVEESGEHIILGTGELYLDVLLHDLREMFAEIEIKVADPVVKFAETVAETSSLKCFAETPNRQNKFTMIAEPLDTGLAADIETGVVPRLEEDRRLFFQSKYGWDVLTSRSVWCFGPDANGPNILLDDTLPTQVDRRLLDSQRDSIVQGFQWGLREGPLCDENIRNVKFRLLHATIASDPLQRARGQLIPTARRVVYSAFLLATPRLMEPIYSIDIQAPPDTVNIVETVLSRRRGRVLSKLAKPGTPLYTVTASIPLIESFGFETDLRTHSQGQAFSTSTFDHWDIVPGDPLDKSIVLRPLEPAPHEALAREFMIKTRRRKGLAEDVAVHKYFDEGLLLELARQNEELAAYFGQQQA